MPIMLVNVSLISRYIHFTFVLVRLKRYQAPPGEPAIALTRTNIYTDKSVNSRASLGRAYDRRLKWVSGSGSAEWPCGWSEIAARLVAAAVEALQAVRTWVRVSGERRAASGERCERRERRERGEGRERDAGGASGAARMPARPPRLAPGQRSRTLYIYRHWALQPRGTHTSRCTAGITAHSSQESLQGHHALTHTCFHNTMWVVPTRM